MSEYQYYEFQAVDRPLTPAEMAELRALTTRATITPTRLQNVYHWGDFKGDPLALMERYFDAFVYVANWGTHRLMLRLPRRLLDPRVARRYETPACLEVHAGREHVVLELTSDDEEGDWGEDDDDEGWMPALLPLRAELAGGDRRALYLAWLAGAQAGDLRDQAREPPVPPGLGDLSASLQALAAFLRLGDDLLAVAAAGSAAPPPAPSAAELGRWIAGLPAAEKDAWLTRVATGEAARVGAELRRGFDRPEAAGTDDGDGGRTVGELVGAAEARAAERRRREAERRAAERARRQREEAAARARYLDGLAGREDALWDEVEALVDTTRPKEYEQAVQLLRDLRDLAARQDGAEAFAARLGSLRRRCAKRPSLLERLDRAGLTV
ncbi:MAG TPA: hypothetical protein VGM69_11630 [Chloroflexota bacterium]|jgi:hypothetical protein